MPNSKARAADHLDAAMVALETIMDVNETGVIPENDEVFAKVPESDRADFKPHNFAILKADKLRRELTMALQAMRRAEGEQSS